MLLIQQGTTPTPRKPGEWARLCEDEQKAVFAPYQGVRGVREHERLLLAAVRLHVRHGSARHKSARNGWST